MKILKKLYLLAIVILTLGLASCDKKSKHKDLKDVTEYVTSLDSYEVKAVLSIKRQDKVVNMDVTVDYLKPSFYKVSFINEAKDEQIVVKNAGGVYVLTPALNKEFKFDSDWPLNSSHAYILQAVVKDITNDEGSSYVIENDIMQAEAKVSKVNSDVVKMKFYYDLAGNKPVKTVFLNANNEEKLTVTFNEFNPNKEMKEETFNTKYIMDQKTNVDEGTGVIPPTILLTVGNTIDGTELSTQEINDNMTVMCFTGDKNYTITAEVAKTYFTSTPILDYDTMEVMKYGVMLFNENSARYYYKDLEISIYSNTLEPNEMLKVAEEMVFE